MIVQNLTERSNWPHCFLGTEYTLNWVKGYGSENLPWQFCTATQGPAQLFRSQQQQVNFEQIITVDPMTARPYGWLTNGSAEVILNSADDLGTLSAIAVNMTLQQMVVGHILSVNYNAPPTVSPILGARLTPSDFSC